MRFSRDCSSLRASPLGLASVQGLLARQLIPMNHEECSPGHHLSVPPWGLEHRLGTSSPDTTQDPPADARGMQISAVLHPTLSMGCRVWFCLRPCSENFTKKKQLQLKESQLQISVMSDWAGWTVRSTLIKPKIILLISFKSRRAYLDLQKHYPT